MTAWIRSSMCSTDHQTGNCVEVLPLADGVAVRDSKDPAGAYLTFSHAEFRAFVAGVKAGDFDDQLS